MHVLVLSLHIIWQDLLFIVQLYKNLLHSFEPNMTFYLRCECATFIHTRTNRNALRSAFLYGQRINVYVQSSALRW